MEGKPQLKVVPYDSPNVQDIAAALRNTKKYLNTARAILIVVMDKDGSYHVENSPVWTSDLALISMIVSHEAQTRLFQECGQT